jgi:hypothetical protein
MSIMKTPYEVWASQRPADKKVGIILAKGSTKELCDKLWQLRQLNAAERR